MSEKQNSYVYETNLVWTEKRKGEMSFDKPEEEKPTIEIATPLEFKGHKGIISPEELFVSSVNGCIMTTFLSFAEKMRITFLSYESYGKGILDVLEKPNRFTKVIIQPKIILDSEENVEKIKRCVQLAEKYCLITSSVNTEVEVLPEIKIKKG